MPTENPVDDSESTDYEATTNSKTTASHSWKSGDMDTDGSTTHKGSSHINHAASASITSAEGTYTDADESTTRRSKSVYSSVYTPSITTRDVHDGTSTFFTDDFSSRKWDDDTNAPAFRQPPALGGVASISMDVDDLESTGVSEILDAEDDEACEEGGRPWLQRVSSNASSASSTDSRHRGHDDAPGFHADRYVSSFSETSTVSYSSYSGHRGRHSATTSSSGSFCSSDESCSSSCTDDDGSWEEAPECGTLMNVKPKLGERVSRVHPDHTSHLLRSRFRKKYFPRGSFPYDK